MFYSSYYHDNNVNISTNRLHKLHDMKKVSKAAEATPPSCA